MNKDRRDMVILGAGLAGSLAAIYLARRGYRVRVFERRGDLRREQVSGGRSINLALANRGIRALARVGLEDDVRKLIITMRGRMLHEPGKEPVLQPYGKDESEVIYSISREGLTALLMDRAEAEGVEIRFDHRVSRIDLESGQVVLDTGSETRLVDNAYVIAADGSGSVVRRTMASYPGCGSSEQFSAHAYKELSIPASAEGDFRIEPNALHIWPRGGFMMIALPNLDRSFTVTLFLPREGENSFGSIETRQQLDAFFAQHFAEALPLLPDLHEEYFANPTGRLVTVRCHPWHVADRALLIGDAAHAIVPFHGQGMNCAFEDCDELDRCLEEIGDDNMEAVFKLFEARRRPNADAIADMAIENYIEMRASVRDPRFHLKKRLAWELEKRWPARFVPRYSMVMFRHIPYADAQRRGWIQQEILESLLTGHGNDAKLDAVDYDEADRLISERLTDIA